MNIQQLEYIIAVDNYRHFSKAAEASFVTQPTLSMMIQKLEEELGVKIFDRSQLPVHPTEIGKRIIDQARVAVAQVNQLKEIVQEEKGIVKGVFRLGIIPTISPYLLPRLMQVHSENKFDIRIVISELTTDQILKGLSNDSLDGGILATPLKEPAIKEHPIYYERFFAYISPVEKTIYAKTSIDESDLTAARLWLLDEVHCFRTQILHLCNFKKRRGGNQQSIFSYEAGSIDTLINIVDKNDGLTVIPEMALSSLSETQMKNVRSFKNSTPVREVSLVTRKEFFRERLLSILIDEVKMAIPRSLQDEAMKKYVVPL
ncbi:MAG: hydrogen peroxide-inducible genes activator [Proteiniphilum sp.]|jgi:LysR family hydrogen peroxide-inducible transcriptional activator|nr:hydrogen peroxide-inducible genes activator [Proteiniphilum sp.]NCB24330.1 hydrogen peroxide-inducible genes activator [Bacteroidia bacterium]MDD2937386.1 hydrogen peroxide-inducible genes activator [Proteiniphilum sp.]MDD3076648.1 hydrogen peroxide-inducible genes activator [Proteiniphilum sp.]MDD3779641.1 hydrogen peroxide-inducible genes activator [Proteiniphilum sp.]